MTRSPVVALLALVGLLAVASAWLSETTAQVAAPKAEPLRAGMTPAEVRAILGPPARISRQIILFRVLEQWHFNQPPHRLTFDSRRGATPRLVLPGVPEPGVP